MIEPTTTATKTWSPSTTTATTTASTPTATAPPTVGQGSTDQNDALEGAKSLFAQLGLPASLVEWAWGEILNNRTPAEIDLDLQQTPEFKLTFPEIELRKQAGLPPVNAAQIVEYRDKAREYAHNAGLPTSFYDQNSDFTNLIVGNVSINEFGDRVKEAQLAAYSIPADVRKQFADVLGIGDFTALAFDPTVAVPILDRKIKEAEVAAGALRGGFALDAAQRAQVTDYLAGQQAGGNVDALAKGFGDLQSQQQLFMDISGNNTEGGQISQQEQLGAEFGGNANAQRRIADRAAKRKAQFEGGAGFGATQQGVSALGAG